MDVNKRIQSNLCRMSTRFPSSGIIELSTIPVMRPLSTTLIRESIIVDHPCVEEVNYFYYEPLSIIINHYQPYHLEEGEEVGKVGVGKDDHSQEGGEATMEDMRTRPKQLRRIKKGPKYY